MIFEIIKDNNITAIKTGISGNDSVEITGGEIEVSKTYEGYEALEIYIMDVIWHKEYHHLIAKLRFNRMKLQGISKGTHQLTEIYAYDIIMLPTVSPMTVPLSR